jgi:hypothetical protein
LAQLGALLQHPAVDQKVWTASRRLRLFAPGQIDCRDLHRTGQQPGAIAPGVAAAPVALAGIIVAGVARFIVVLSAHADVFGVGMTAIVGSMLVPPS